VDCTYPIAASGIIRFEGTAARRSARRSTASRQCNSAGDALLSSERPTLVRADVAYRDATLLRFHTDHWRSPQRDLWWHHGAGELAIGSAEPSASGCGRGIWGTVQRRR